MSTEFEILKINGNRLRSEFELLKIEYLKKEEELKVQQNLEDQQAHKMLLENIKNEYQNFKKNNSNLISQIENINLILEEIEQKRENLLLKEKLIKEYYLKKGPELYEFVKNSQCKNP